MVSVFCPASGFAGAAFDCRATEDVWSVASFSPRNSYSHFALACALWANWVSACDPTSQASGWRAQNCFMSDIVADAALTACAAPTPSGVFIESGVGNSMTTMLSQNAVRIRKNMTLPFAPNILFAAGVRLAEAFEGGICLVL